MDSKEDAMQQQRRERIRYCTASLRKNRNDVDSLRALVELAAVARLEDFEKFGTKQVVELVQRSAREKAKCDLATKFLRLVLYTRKLPQEQQKALLESEMPKTALQSKSPDGSSSESDSDSDESAKDSNDSDDSDSESDSNTDPDSDSSDSDTSPDSNKISKSDTSPVSNKTTEFNSFPVDNKPPWFNSVLSHDLSESSSDSDTDETLEQEAERQRHRNRDVQSLQSSRHVLHTQMSPPPVLAIRAAKPTGSNTSRSGGEASAPSGYSLPVKLVKNHPAQQKLAVETTSVNQDHFRMKTAPRRPYSGKAKNAGDPKEILIKEITSEGYLAEEHYSYETLKGALQSLSYEKLSHFIGNNPRFGNDADELFKFFVVNEFGNQSEHKPTAVLWHDFYKHLKNVERRQRVENRKKSERLWRENETPTNRMQFNNITQHNVLNCPSLVQFARLSRNVANDKHESAKNRSGSVSNNGTVSNEPRVGSTSESLRDNQGSSTIKKMVRAQIRGCSVGASELSPRSSSQAKPRNTGWNKAANGAGKRGGSRKTVPVQINTPQTSSQQAPAPKKQNTIFSSPLITKLNGKPLPTQTNSHVVVYSPANPLVHSTVNHEPIIKRESTTDGDALRRSATSNAPAPKHQTENKQQEFDTSSSSPVGSGSSAHETSGFKKRLARRAEAIPCGSSASTNMDSQDQKFYGSSQAMNTSLDSGQSNEIPNTSLSTGEYGPTGIYRASFPSTFVTNIPDVTHPSNGSNNGANRILGKPNAIKTNESLTNVLKVQMSSRSDVVESSRSPARPCASQVSESRKRSATSISDDFQAPKQKSNAGNLSSFHSTTESTDQTFPTATDQTQETTEASHVWTQMLQQRKSVEERKRRTENRRRYRQKKVIAEASQNLIGRPIPSLMSLNL